MLSCFFKSWVEEDLKKKPQTDWNSYKTFLAQQLSLTPKIISVLFWDSLKKSLLTAACCFRAGLHNSQNNQYPKMLTDTPKGVSGAKLNHS